MEYILASTPCSQVADTYTPYPGKQVQTSLGYHDFIVQKQGNAGCYSCRISVQILYLFLTLGEAQQIIKEKRDLFYICPQRENK